MENSKVKSEIKTQVQSIVIAIKRFMENYYDVTLPPEKLKFWTEELSAYSLDTVTKAFKSYIRHNRNFAPNLAGIIAEAESVQEEKNGETKEQTQFNAEKAWMNVLDAVHYVGIYGTPDFEDKTIHNAIARLGGWEKICSSTYKEMDFLKKEFLQIYQSCIKYADSLDDVTLGNSNVMKLINGNWERETEKSRLLEMDKPVSCSEETHNRWLKYLEDSGYGNDSRP